MKNHSFDKGLKKRKKVLGNSYVNNAKKKTNLFNEDFQSFITENCWDKVWNNKHLTDKQKSLNTLSILASSNKWHEFKIHITGSLNNGCTLFELKELFMQITLYCGVPTGNECFRIASEVFTEKKINVAKIFK